MLENKEIIKIIDALCSCNLSQIEVTEYNWDYIVDDFIYAYGKNVSNNYGATKGVLIFDDLDFVIKIPFSGYYIDNDYIGFTGSEFGWNYCEDEIKYFNLAKEQNVEQFFVQTSYLTSIDGYPIYIQNYIPEIGLRCSDYAIKTSEESKTKVRSICEEKNLTLPMNVQWLGRALEYYGEEALVKLLIFIKNLHLDDFHSDNIGFIGKRPIILDYAGFNK